MTTEERLSTVESQIAEIVNAVETLGPGVTSLSELCQELIDVFDTSSYDVPELHDLQRSLTSRLYTVKGELIGYIDNKVYSLEENMIRKMDEMEGRLLREMRNGHDTVTTED